MRLAPRPLLPILAVALIAAACSAGASVSDPAATPGAPGAPTSSPSPGLITPGPSKPVPGDGDLLTGTLGSDSIEGGCVFLRTPDGQRYEVIYPDGWDVRKSPAEIVDPTGRVHARSGDSVTVRGSVSGDMASICQIGPIFVATEVVND